MAQYESWFKQDLKKPIKVQLLNGNLFSQDNQGNLIGVEVFDNGEPASLAGTVSANIIRADGGTVAATGTLSGNKCSVVLPAAAYAIPGLETIVIKLTSSGVVTTLLALVVTIYRASTDTAVDPGTVMPSIQSLIQQINTAVASIPADYSSLWTSLAPAFSTDASYAAGQYVTYNGKVYRFNTAHSGEWAAGDVSEVKVGNELTDLKSAFDDLETEIFDAIDVAILISNIPGITKVAGTVTGITSSTPAGIKFDNNQNYDSYYIPITEPISISFNTANSKYLSLCIAENYSGMSVGGTVLIGENGVRYRKSESNLPTVDNPISVPAGSVIAFSMTANSDDSVFGFDTEHEVDKDFADNVVKTAGIDYRPPVISYTTSVDWSGTYGTGQLSIFLPTKAGYVKYAFVHCVNNTKNADSWRIDRAIACNDNLQNRYQLTQGGEWEMVLHVQDAPDFTGGIAHGDEYYTSLDVIIDGQYIEDITSLNNLPFSECVIKETSILYDPSDGATLETREQFTPFATHGRTYIITTDGIRLMQEVTFDQAITLVQSYMTMLPIIRGNDAVSEEQITDHYFANNNYTTYDVSVGGIGEGYGWKPNVTMAHIWGNTSGVLASVEMLKQPEIDNAGARRFQVQSTVDAYNKLYWSVCGVANNPYTVSVGERFVTDTIYKISVAI